MPRPQLPRVRYAPGPGVLLGAGARWLLLGLSDADDPRLEQLWDLLTGPVVDPERVLAAVEERYGAEVPLVLLDLTPGSGGLVERGGARLRRDGERRLLMLGHGETALPSRRLASGLVAAGAAEVTPAARRSRPGREPRPAPRPVPGVIDGVPPEILTASAPTPPEPTAPGRSVDEERAQSTTDEPLPSSAPPTSPPTSPPGAPLTHTTYRPDRAARLAGEHSGGAVDHLRQGTHETVLAVRCAHGHLTPALSANCRICHAPVPPQDPERVPRPRLGVLRLPDGTAVPLDRGAVFGRQPEPQGGAGDWPQLVKLPTESSFVSRNHLQVELDGWLVLATDLGSRSGTTLRVAGREPERIRAGERYIWEPGQVLDLADSYEILYEVLPDDAASDAGPLAVDGT